LSLKTNIIIINWNGYKDTEELLNSLSLISYKNCSITVVDNNSSGDDVEKLKKYFGNKIQIIQSKNNRGFAGGNNIGIKKALEEDTELVLLLNNDTIVEPDFLDKLVNDLNDDENIGIFAPRINYYYEIQKIWSEGGTISKIKASGFADSDKLETELDSKKKYVSFVSGCCMLIKREVFERIGLFDENYFLYLEDTDLCSRSKKAGYEIVVIPESKIYHKVGNSTKKNNPVIPLYYTTRNRLYFSKKNYPGLFFITVVYLALVMFIKSLKWFVTGKFNYIRSVKNAFSDFFAGRFGKNNFY
jgi:GT2 family glycosyltransferase